MDLKYPELENGQEYLPKYLMLKDRIIEVSEEERPCRRPKERNFGMSSGGSVATAVKIAEELDSGVRYYL
jgi:cysteine synthase B